MHTPEGGMETPASAPAADAAQAPKPKPERKTDAAPGRSARQGPGAAAEQAPAPGDASDVGRMSDERRGLGLVLPPRAPLSSIDGRSRPWDVPDIPKNLKQDPYRSSDQQGLASWYGGRFHGRKTASGEQFDKEGFTAAHKTLPFDTQICVRSMVTGKTVVVRVNDRGPYSGDRIIDLSQGAAQELGMIGLGIKPVELWTLDEEDDDCPSFVLAGRRNPGKLTRHGAGKAAEGMASKSGRVHAVVPAQATSKAKAKAPAPKRRYKK